MGIGKVPKELSTHHESIATTDRKHLIETVMLRSLKQAQYVAGQ